MSGSSSLPDGPWRAAVEARLARFDEIDFAERLWRHDPTLWSDDPAHQQVAAHRLGWLDSPDAMRKEIASLRAFAAEAAKEGFTRAVVLGMGGSSLAPEVLRLTLGVAPGALDLTVLDNTCPASVRAVAESHDPARTLFLVSSKSGGTIEVASFEKWFWAWVKARRGAEAGRSFVAITDPGTALESLAREKGYRRTFINPPDIGGRYSALSYFGLVPAALVGADLEALMDHAGHVAAARRPAAGAGARAAREIPGLALGALLGELAVAGRDKLTLVLSPEIEALGSWIEQLVAESTGKNGRGIVPVAEESLGAPEAYAGDRVFVAVSSDPLAAAAQKRLDALAAAGHPVASWRIPSLEALGGEFLRWEIATVAAATVLGVDPFDEPNVTEAKQATQAVLARYLSEGRFPERPRVAEAGELAAYAPPAVAQRLAAHLENGGSPGDWTRALLGLAGEGDYVALLAYLHRTPARHERLQRLRHAARSATRAATTLGYGPRFLHSTGQLHKGGPPSGIFLLLTADDEGSELPIPGEPYGFGALRFAQAAGDYDVLERRARRVLRVHLGAAVEKSLDVLTEAVAAAGRV